MPLAGFEPTIPMAKRAKTFHALDRDRQNSEPFIPIPLGPSVFKQQYQ
jgi:hypothetical protein